MADFDSKLPVRALAADFTTEVANASGTTINPVEEFAQGSTTSGQSGALEQGAVTTAAPTYTTGTTAPLSLDTNGNLRTTSTFTPSGIQNVNITEVGGNAVTTTVPVSGTIAVSNFPAGVTEVAPDYKQAVAIAAGATDTHTFTPGGTILLDKIVASASGAFKCEIQWGTTGSETTKAVFFGSASSQNVELELPNPVSIPNTSSIKVIMKNKEPVTAQDLYSSIIYH